MPLIKELGNFIYKCGDLKLYLWALTNYNFGEFLRFFLKGLNPFKIRIKFKILKIAEFVV
jgi:hypothetical protein